MKSIRNVAPYLFLHSLIQIKFVDHSIQQQNPNSIHNESESANHRCFTVFVFLHMLDNIYFQNLQYFCVRIYPMVHNFDWYRGFFIDLL